MPIDPIKDFKEPLSEALYDFADAVGLSSYLELTGDSYNTDTGVRDPTYEEQFAPMAGDAMMASLGVNASVEYQHSHLVIYVMADDLTSKPKEGDLIIPAWLGTKHKIDNVDGDMYGVAWIIHVIKTPEPEG